LLTLKEGFEGEMNENNIELAVVDETRRFRVLTPSEIRDYLTEVS
jgi:20S proteasome subunit alpha 2